MKEKEPQPKRHKLRRAITAGILALSGPSVLAPTLEAATPASASELPASVLAKKDPEGKPHKLKPEKKKERKLSKEEKQIQRLEQNIAAAFALSDEEIMKYGMEKTPISYLGTPWSFPHWYDNTNGTIYPDGRFTIDYSTGFSMETEPNFSIFGAGFDTESYSLLAIRLGSVRKPLDTPDSSIRIGAYFVKFPSKMGGFRAVVFRTENVKKPDDQRFQRGGDFHVAGEEPEVYHMSTSILRVGGASPTTRREYRNLLKKNRGKPVFVLSGFKPTPEGEVLLPGLSDIVAKNREFYASMITLFQGKPDLFAESLKNAALQGLIVTPDDPKLPEFITQGRSTFEEYLEFAPFAFLGVFPDETPPVLSLAS